LYDATIMRKTTSRHDPRDAPLVARVRAASRVLVRELGFMRPTLAATAHSPSAVHALLEIGARGGLSAAELADVLALEKSSVSRMLRKLIDGGELREMPSADDGRVKLLQLGPRGRRTLATIHAFADDQVATALARLGEPRRHAVAEGLEAYAQALAAQRRPSERPAPPDIRIETGYRPGVIGRVAEMHGRYYAREVGFGQFFESKVAAGLAEFAGRLERPGNRLWVALQGERIVGSVAIDGEDLGGNTAHLRWFILADGLRGAGIGRRLLGGALAFCDERAFASTQLWTLRGLDAARRLYEAGGFVLAEESHGDQWGKNVVEQRFTRARGALAR
jgi:DNA-binding MarR family transcriptional regulator/ribosomal protein S18 acetylase RimI-like enzyme